MVQSLSAKKRARQNVKQNKINRARKSSVKTQIKHFGEVIKSEDVDNAQKQFTLTAQQLDKVASKGTVHKNTAARTKSRLAKRLETLKQQKSD